jgi:hypothetical protein
MLRFLPAIGTNHDWFVALRGIEVIPAPGDRDLTRHNGFAVMAAHVLLIFVSLALFLADLTHHIALPTKGVVFVVDNVRQSGICDDVFTSSVLHYEIFLLLQALPGNEATGKPVHDKFLFVG